MLVFGKASRGTILHLPVSAVEGHHEFLYRYLLESMKFGLWLADQLQIFPRVRADLCLSIFNFDHIVPIRVNDCDHRPEIEVAQPDHFTLVPLSKFTGRALVRINKKITLVHTL